MDYTLIIPKEKLEHGAYYIGRCRNAQIARWNAITQKFTYWRMKFGDLFTEEIAAPEDDAYHDVFLAEDRIHARQGVREIPFPDETEVYGTE